MTNSLCGMHLHLHCCMRICVYRLKNAGIQLSNTDLPPLIPELSGQYSGYNGVQPCFDTMLYQMQHINETVIALPRAMQVQLLSSLPAAAISQVYTTAAPCVITWLFQTTKPGASCNSSLSFLFPLSSVSVLGAQVSNQVS